MNWRTYRCDRCPKLVKCRTQGSKVVVASPCLQGGFLAIGEAPGADEDQSGIGFLGKAGQTLRNLLRQCGLSCTDYGVANVCRCRPRDDRGRNRAPSSDEIENCLPFLKSLIEEIKPKVLLAVGGRTAVRVLCDDRHRLYSIIESKNRLDPKDWAVQLDNVHEGIRSALSHVRYIVPMPHTSSVLNGKKAPKPSTELWSEIAKRQVELAVDLFNNH